MSLMSLMSVEKSKKHEKSRKATGLGCAVAVAVLSLPLLFGWGPSAYATPTTSTPTAATPTAATPTIAASTAVAGKKVYKKVNCALCHGAKGMGKAKGSKFSLTKGPRIAGLSQSYVVKQMNDIKDKKRKSRFTSMMRTKIKKLSATDIDNVAAYVASLGPSYKGIKEK